MDQSDARHLQRLPVIDCPQLDGEMAALIARSSQPGPAEIAARIVAAHAPSAAPAVPPPNALRERMSALRESTRHRNEEAVQAATWNGADSRLRAMLTHWAGLRAAHPQQTLHELAARAWGELPPHERAKIASAIRVLQRLLGALWPIAAIRA